MPLAPLCARGDKRPSQAAAGRRCPPSMPSPGGAAGSRAHTPLSLSLPKGLRLAAGMKLVPVALLYLSSLAFLGADAAQLDVASEFRKK